MFRTTDIPHNWHLIVSSALYDMWSVGAPLNKHVSDSLYIWWKLCHFIYRQCSELFTYLFDYLLFAYLYVFCEKKYP